MARPTVRILSRYILRQHFPPLGYALAALTFAMLINQIAKQFANFVGKGLRWHVIFEVFALSIPFIVAMTLPMAVLVAVLYSFSHLAADNEVTAMKASGISVGQLLAPVLFGATVMALIAFFWNDQVLPRSNHRLRTLIVDIQRKKPTFQLKEQVINEVIAGQFFLRAARIDPAANSLSDVTIYDMQDPERRRIISADSGRMAYTPGGEDLYLTLRDGEVQEVKRDDPTHFNRTFYVVNRIKVAGVGNQFEQTLHDTYRSDREMTICAMEQVVAQARQEAERTRRDALDAVDTDLRRQIKVAPRVFPVPALVDSAPLPHTLYCRVTRTLARLLTPKSAHAAEVQQSSTVFDQRVRAARQRAAVYQVEIQKKLAISTACIIFALFGVPIAIRFPRGGVGLVIGTSLVVYAIYYVGLIAGEDFGDRLIVSPFIAMWLPNLIVGIAALVLLGATRRGGSTAHGGDWDDVKQSLFGWLRR